MEGSFQRLTADAASTSAATPTPAVDTTAAPLYPGWVLLEEEAYNDAAENATTAEARMITGHTVKVTFFLADPPDVSYFSVYGPELYYEDFRLVARVVFSEKDLVLLHFKFFLRPGRTAAVRDPPPAQYFVYKAAAHGRPSLTAIPTTRRPDNSIASYPSILPFEDDEHGNFLVADLAITPTRAHYVLNTFSSKTNQWTARPLQLQLQPPPAVSGEARRSTYWVQLHLLAPPLPAVTDDLPSLPHKVVALGAGAVGWVDLWRGIVVCDDVFAPDPVLRFIPLPKPEFNLRRRGDPRRIRDVTCCNGFIKFIEMEHYPRPDFHIKRNFKTTKDLDTKYVLHDSELFFHSYEDLTKEPDVPDAWMIRTCFRHVSWNLWCKGHATLHVDDILVNDPSYYMTLPELWDFGAAKFTLRNLVTFCPTLSIHGGDLVYLVFKVGDYDNEAWVVGVDLRRKTVEVLGPAGRSSLHFLACTFSGYLNATPRSCAPEDGCGQNCPLNRYLRSGNIIPNNLIAGGYSRSSTEHGNDIHPVNSCPFQPQLVVPPHSFPQTLQHNFTPSGSGYVGQLWRLMPMDSRFQPQMPEESASPAVPFNTQMPQVPMVDRFLSQMPPVPASLAVPFNTLMPRVPMDDPFLSQMSPVPASLAVPFNTLIPLVPMDDGCLSQMPPVPAYPAVHHS